MFIQLRRISKFVLVVLLLDTEIIAAYVHPAKRCCDFRLQKNHFIQQSPHATISNKAYIDTHRLHHRHGIAKNRDRIGNIGTVLASSFLTDNNQNETLEHPANSGGINDDNTQVRKPSERSSNADSDIPSVFQRAFDEIPFIHLFNKEGRKRLPPLQVDDFGIMMYDVFLIINLSLSISIWVTHRLDVTFLPYAFNEGCLFSILWIASGLYHGSFLYSAMDGHYPLDDEQGRGGPLAAAALAFNTYINAINLRLISALVGALIEHRKVGEGSPMEDLIPLEIGYGLILMTMWRALHSLVTPRVR